MLRFVTLVTLSLITMLSFQNCSSGFSPISSTTGPASSDGSSSESEVTPGTQQPPTTTTPATPSLGDGYDIIVIAGQSNAQGTGLGPVTVDKSQDSRIFQLGRNEVDKQIIPGTDDLQHFTYPANKNMTGFGMAFAREYAKTMAANRKVLLIPTASGGTSILLWANNEQLYVDMKARVLYALSLNPQNRIVAFLWHQGESDVMNIIEKNPLLSTPAQYAVKLQALARSVRSDFQAGGSFPILVGDLVPAWNSQLGVDVKAARASLMSTIQSTLSSIQPAYFVHSMGLLSNYEAGTSTSIIEKIHFSAVSQIELGKRYHQVFVSKQNGPSSVISATSTVSNLLVNVLGRTQDEVNQDIPGLSYWVHQYLQGMSVSQITNNLISSDEYFLRQTYLSELKRRADFDGLLYYLGQLSSGASTRQQIILEFRNICQMKIRGECS